MIVNIVGSNAVGKTWLINRLQQNPNCVQLSLAPPLPFTKAVQETVSDKDARVFLVKLLTRFEFRFSKRLIWCHRLLHVQQDMDRILLYDENFVKKYYEVIPLDVTDSYAQHLLASTRFLNEHLLSLIAPTTDAFLLLKPSETTYLRRAKERGFVTNDLHESQMLRRYRIQNEMWLDLFELAESFGLRTMCSSFESEEDISQIELWLYGLQDSVSLPWAKGGKAR